MSFLRQFLLYGVLGAVSRLAAVVLVPLYTRTLSIPEYGQLEVLLAIHALSVLVAGMQIESALARDYLDAKMNKKAPTLAWAALLLTIAGSLLIGLIILVSWKIGWLPPYFDGRVVGLLVALTLPVQLFGLQLVMLRFEGNSVVFAFLSFFDLLLCALFSVWYIVGMKLGVVGALCGVLSGKLFSVALSWRYTFRMPPLKGPDRDLFAGMLSYAIPLIPAVLIGWGQTIGSRLLLVIVLTLTDVAFAAIAVKVAAIYGFVVASFRLAWEPYSISQFSSVGEDPLIYNRAFEWYVVTMFLTCGLSVLLAPFLTRILAPASYALASSVSIFFMFGQFWVGLINVLVIGIHGSRRTSRLLPVFGSGALINVILLFLLAPFIGVLAAGVGFLGGSVLSASLSLYYSNKYFDTRFSTKLFKWTLVSTLLFLIIWYPIISHRVITFTIPWIWLFIIGLTIIIALLSVIIRFSLKQGRIVEMWNMLSEMVIRRIRSI